MANQFGISFRGRFAEQLFLNRTGAEKSPSASAGDAIIDGNAIEIKRAKTNTINQVRAVKYNVLAIYYCPNEIPPSWYIVPPDMVCRLVSRKRRGQHTENPFESSTLNIKDLADYQIHDETQLRESVLKAVRKGAQYPDLQDAMICILERERLHARQDRELVATL